MSQLQVTGEAKIRDIQGPVVANSGVVTALDGDASQYVRGDGTLADFPTSTGGGSSVSYYLNSSVSQGTLGGVAYRQLGKTPIAGTGTDIAISSNGYVASYITDANDPSLLEVPAGNFNCEFYFSVNSNAHNPYVYAELYKYDGTTFTLLGSNQAIPEYLTNGTTLSAYYFAIPVAVAALSVTDRISIRIYVNVDGRTVTLHTEDNHLCQVVTTFSKGLISLNNLTRQNQFFATGTSGTDFGISSSVATHTFNLPVASAANTGKLSSTDWSTFNNKQNTITDPITGTGASTQIAYFNSGTSITSEAAFNYDASTNRLGVNTSVPNATIGANAGTDSGYSLLVKNDNANYNGIGFATDSTYGNLIATEKLGTALTRNLTLLNQSGYISLTEAGNLGVGILSPNTGLDIYNGTSAYLWLHTANSGVTGTDGVRLALFSTNGANLRNYEGAFSITAEGDFSIITIGAENFRVNSADGSIYQSKVANAMLKSVSGVITAAVANTDYQSPITLTTSFSSGSSTFVGNTLNVPTYTLSGLGGVPTSRTLTINGTDYDLSADRSWTVGTITGSGAATEIPYFSTSTAITSEAAFNYDASTNRLGVNTSNPNATIGGNSALDSGYGLLIKTGASNYNGIGIAIDSTYGNLISTEKLGTATARNLTLLNQSGFVSLKENGNFGVNTLNPSVSGTGIDIYGSTSTSLRLHTATSGTTVSDGAGINFSAANNLGITNYEAGAIDIVTNGNSGVYIASNGYVGINGATPSVALTVTGAITQTSVTSSLLKTDSGGLLIAAVAGTDYVIPSALSSYVPTNRTLTINGTAYDLSANRSWSVGTTTGSGTTNYLPKFTGSTSIGDSAITDNGTTVTLISRTLTATSGSFITNDNNFLFNVELKNTNAGTQALTGLGLADLSGTRKGQVLWIPSNYVTTSLQNSFLVSSVTNIPLILCADATGAATPNIKFQSGATDKMTLFGSTGNLSIGNSTDSGNKLHITAIAPILAIESSTTGNVFLRMLQAGTVVSSLFYNNATSTLTLSNNNAGIQFNTSGLSNAFNLSSAGAATFSSSVGANGIMSLGDDGTYGSTYKTLGLTGNTNGSHRIFAGTADNMYLAAATGRGIYLCTNGTVTPRLTVDTSGNVGIGTSSPVANDGTSKTFQIGSRLAIQNVVGTQFLLSSNLYYDGAWKYMVAGKGQAIRGTGESGAIQFSLSPTGTAGGSVPNMDGSDVKMIILESGNVGIGTISPNTTLDVNGTINVRTNGYEFGRITTNNISANQGGLSFQFNQSGTFVEGFRLNASGNVLIGTTTNASSKLRVSAATDWSGEFVNNHAAGQQLFTLFTYGSTGLGSIQGNGSIVSYYSTSDYRLKEDLQDFDALSKISLIKVYDYKWKNTGQRMDGFMAHELQEVLPYAVSGEKDGEQMQNVDYSKLTPVNTKAIQELYALVQEQQAQIEELKQLILNK